jgi:hypothetical protein
MPLSPTSVGSEQTAGLRQLMKPFDVSKLSHMPFTGRDISPSNTQDELLDFTQQLINFSTRGIPPPTATWMNTPHDVDERQASSVALVELVDAAPISSTPLMAPTPPAEPALHSNVPVVPLDTLLSQASMYLVKPPKEINKHARPSHLQPEKEPETRAIGVFGGYIEVPAASTAPTGAWESSDEAIWKFPPAEGMAGIENPEGMAHIRLKNMKDKRCMGLGMGILNRERVEREELFRLGELFMKVLQGEQVETFSQNEALCTECASLMLTPENFLPKGPYSDRIPREWREPLFDFAFTKLRDSETCPLCWLMRYALETACHADAIDSDRLHCTLFMTHFSAFWDNEMRYESFRFLTVVGKEPGSNCSEITVDLLPVETKQYPLTFIGRLVQPDKISPGLVRRWLQQCEQVHGPNCSRLDFGYNADLRSAGPPSQHESRFSNLVQSLYFVDVRENCLRTLSTPDRYLALSYVWGASKSPFTIKVNLHDRLKPNGLLAIRDQLPAVIVDAMTLTKDIGERYLWVDSLCIVQDDDETKQRAISKMDIVYENALLVIISAAGANADTGLPGVKPNTRRETQVSATIARDLRLIVPHTLRALDHSIWASRAWT